MGLEKCIVAEVSPERSVMVSPSGVALDLTLRGGQRRSRSDYIPEPSYKATGVSQFP